MDYIGIIVLVVLSAIGFFIKAERTKLPKLFKILSWIVMIGFGCMYTIGYSNTLDDYNIFSTFTYFLFDSQNDILIPCIVAELVILLIFNMISVKNKVKAVILTISQIALSMLIMTAVLFVVALFLLLTATGHGDTAKKIISRKSHTEQEDIYAKANGFYDAETANASGFKTAEANQPGFDFTKKK